MPDHAPPASRLTLRDTAADMGWDRNFLGEDWSVMLDGEAVGRIKTRAGRPSESPAWSWFVTVPLADSGYGLADGLDEAKRQWRAAWERLLARSGQDRIEAALRAARDARERSLRWAEQHTHLK